jgi:NodT family efflux transporter outer membrane factor (OMF) lipoprotein
MMHRSILLPALGGLLLISACRVVGPNYTRPSVPTAPTHKEATPEAFKEAPGWKKSEPRDEMTRGRWWEMFGDARLNEYEIRAMVANQTIKQSEAAFRQARAVVRINRAGYYPTVGVSPSVGFSKGRAGTGGNTGGTTTTTTTGGIPTGTTTGTTTVGTTGSSLISTLISIPFDVSWEPDLWGRVSRLVESANSLAEASAADLENVRLTIQSELASDYFQLRTLDATAQLLENTVAAYEKALQLTINRYNGGIASQVDVAQAQTQVETTRAQLIDLGVTRAQYEHAIATLAGESASNFSIPRLPIEGLPPLVPPGLPSALLERRPDVAGTERRVAAANAQIGVAQAAYYPTFSISAAAGLQASLTNFFTSPTRFWSVGPSLAQTLFDGGRRRGLTDQAIAAYDQTVAAYRQSALTAFQEVEDDLAELRILEQEADRQAAAVRSAEKSLSLSVERYKGGIATYLEVITAQSVALQNERTAVTLLGRRMVADVLLVKAIGGGWDETKLPSERSLKQ